MIELYNLGQSFFAQIQPIYDWLMQPVSMQNFLMDDILGTYIKHLETMGRDPALLKSYYNSIVSLSNITYAELLVGSGLLVMLVFRLYRFFIKSIPLA